MTKPILIRKLGLEIEVVQLRAKGLGAKAITSILRDKGHNLSYKAVENFLVKDSQVKQEVIATRRDLQENAVTQELSVISQINRLNEEMWHTLDELKAKRDFKSMPSVANSLTKLLELQSKLLGQLQPEKKDITVILAGLNKK